MRETAYRLCTGLILSHRLRRWPNIKPALCRAYWVNVFMITEITCCTLIILYPSHVMMIPNTIAEYGINLITLFGV